ncbi:hypothetical protein OCJ37_14205 [Xanthomonas sp. AM6]|uniref:hypothetical protein n=1 Tax=Xanthomonas sp. AM6 TaxID=2982531 RepID=UPI0021DB2F1A|nr:hypothetical protein [Xanthomonas sp. AM6]UYB51138.1 hypothetical protein OCJ37_14205 [Xanthomonas sp. AM6]
MYLKRSELDDFIDALAAELPELVDRCDSEATFLAVLAEGQASIVASAAQEDQEYVLRRIGAMRPPSHSGSCSPS